MASFCVHKTHFTYFNSKQQINALLFRRIFDVTQTIWTFRLAILKIATCNSSLAANCVLPNCRIAFAACPSVRLSVSLCFLTFADDDDYNYSNCSDATTTNVTTKKTKDNERVKVAGRLHLNS